MPSGSYWQAYVQCPYYKFDDGKRHIHCEGVTDTCTLRVAFSCKAEYERYIEHYCCRHHDTCLVYRAVHNSYEGAYDED